MKITLTPSQIAALKLAPNDWRTMPPSASIDALRRQDLVVIRDTPGETGLMRGFQWKITLTGFYLDGRKIQPKPEPEAAVLHRAAVDDKTPA